MAGFVPDEAQQDEWWNEEVVPERLKPLPGFPRTFGDDSLQLWITTVRHLNCLVSNGACPLNPGWYILVLRRPDGSLVFETDAQVKMHVILHLDHAIDIIGQYLFHEDRICFKIYQVVLVT